MTTKTLNYEHGFHVKGKDGHDVTLVRDSINHDMTYTEIRKIPTQRDDMATAKLFKAVIRLNAYPSQTSAKLFVWRGGWQEFHKQLITDLPAYTLNVYAKADELDLSKFEASCEHLWLMAKEYGHNL